jgi:hypothetical protein
MLLLKWRLEAIVHTPLPPRFGRSPAHRDVPDFEDLSINAARSNSVLTVP